MSRYIAEELISQALEVATRSPLKRHRTGAIIFDKDGGVLSMGWSHPAVGLTDTPWSRHAENHAIGRCKVGALLGYAHGIVIATLTEYGYETTGRPCISCAKQIKKVGIETVIYTQSRSD